MLPKTVIPLLFALALRATAQEPALPEAAPLQKAGSGSLTLNISKEETLKIALAACEKGDHSPAVLSMLLPHLADPAQRGAVKNALHDPLPFADLVAVLKQPSLAARLGALELLEEAAGGDFGFNPWNSPDQPENVGPIARWEQWAAKGPDKKSSPATALLGDDQRRGYLGDLLSSDTDKATRARHMLETDGLGSVAFLEDYLAATPALATGARARVRQAQYQIVLAPRLGPGAAEAARNLAFGSRDQLLSALATAKAAGAMSLPILRDFITHEDPLVRETAMDSILATGGADALPLVAPILEKEPDVNVIQGALRRLKDIPGAGSAKLAGAFLHHTDEDLLVSAIQTCLKLTGGGTDAFSSRGSSRTPTAIPAEDSIVDRLTDPRWRVRVAALEYVAGRKISKASETVLKLLDDPDEFVRYAAIKTAAALGTRSALPKLKATLLANENMAGPVFEGYAAMGSTPDVEMLAFLAKASPEARIAAVRAAETNPSLSGLVARFANDPDTDVACAALRFLSSDAERTATSANASLLVQALRSGQPEKRAAVLDRLVLPPSTSVDPAVMQLLGSALERPEKTTLDPLYDGFLNPLGGATSNSTTAAPPVQIPAAQAALVAELVKLSHDDTAAGLQYSAALTLARAGQPEGYKTLTRLLPNLSTAQKAAIAEDLREPSRREALPLLDALLRDPIDEIRSAAASCALSNDKAPAFIQLVLNELIRPGTLLQPQEVYSYHFESLLREQSGGTVVRWAAKILQDEASSSPLKVLACLSLRNQVPAAALPALTALAKGSPEPWLRRAAAHALGCARPAEWKSLVEALAADPSPYVREVVPAVANRKYILWIHHFDDVHSSPDNSYYYNSSERPNRPDAAVITTLERLASPAEISPVVRFNALFALLAAGKPVDINAMVQLLSKQPEDSRVSYYVAEWFESSINLVGPGVRPLFAAIDTSRIQAEKLSQLAKRLNPAGSSEKAPVSFASLASHAADASAPQQVTSQPQAPATVNRTSLPVVFFSKPGCRECARARELLASLKRDFPTLVVDEHNGQETEGIVFNQALCARFQVPSVRNGISPAIFTQSGFLITDDIGPNTLADLFAKTLAATQDDSWKVIAQPEVEAAKEQVARHYDSLTIPIVIGAGLLDGVNPCAFATIIFFLSYLQIARRSPREMLLTGAAFIIGVFLAYLAAGLVLYKVLATLHERFAGIQVWMNWIFAILAIIAAILSFRDAIQARRGKMEDMTLQLPAFLKSHIRGVIRTGAKARRFVIAAFITGIVVSFIELACTGQVYAPIVYQIQQGKLDAVAMLVLYNIAFILPLIAIFLLAYGGLRSEALIALQKKHTFAVKVALGVLFVLLAAFILLGDRLVPSL